MERIQIMNNKKTEIGEPLARQIIDIEWKMFTSVRAAEPSACQQNENIFRLMRRMAHSTHGIEFLKSYLGDLQEAWEQGRNLMTEKYALMQGAIPHIKDDGDFFIIRRIADFEERCMEKTADKYPELFIHRDRRFRNYLEAELETLSRDSIDFYYEEVLAAAEKDMNIVEERYQKMCEMLGMDSIEELAGRINDIGASGEDR